MVDRQDSMERISFEIQKPHDAGEINTFDWSEPDAANPEAMTVVLYRGR